VWYRYRKLGERNGAASEPMGDGDSYKGGGNHLSEKMMRTDVLRRKRGEKRRDIFFLFPLSEEQVFQRPLHRLVTLEVYLHPLSLRSSFVYIENGTRRFLSTHTTRRHVPENSNLHVW
jgi:hypothetical protein